MLTIPRAVLSCNALKKRAPSITAILSYSYRNGQMEYINTITENKTNNWPIVKDSILTKPGSINEKNIDAVLLRYMVNHKKFDAALSYANHIKESQKELELGSTNGLLHLYYELSKVRKLSDQETQFILNQYKILHDKYKILDSATCERLLHALCAIDEWKKAVKVLDDIYVTSTATYSAHSTIVATLFKNNKKTEAIKLIEQSLSNRRQLQHKAYEAWIAYTLRKFKVKSSVEKYLDEIGLHLSTNGITVSDETAKELQKAYASIGWNVQPTSINKQDGQCKCCKNHLDRFQITVEQFESLQQNIKNKLIIGSDLFLKTSPTELDRFLKFIKDTAPYDIVIDGLNVAYSVGKTTHVDKLKNIDTVVDYFLKRNKKVLLLGRKHMLKWPQRPLQNLICKTSSFFLDDLSQDDPYFLTAAILSGPNTDILSKDLLRGHSFLLKDEQLRVIFKRWLWQHQWMIFATKSRGVKFQVNVYQQQVFMIVPVGPLKVFE